MAAPTKTSGGNAAFHNFHNDFAHIQDPNERRRLALAEIDKAPFGWYHVRAIVVAGIGFCKFSFVLSGCPFVELSFFFDFHLLTPLSF